MTITLSSISKGRVLPKIIGHRGACGHAPENTMASFRKAAELGVEWVEFDTRLTASGDVVVFHDDTLDRTTNGHGAVASTGLTDIQALDAGSWFHEDFSGESVSTLQDVIQLLAELGMAANVEIKPSAGCERETARAVCDVIRAAWPDTMPLPVISSFRDECLAVAGDRLPWVERALLIEDELSGWRSRTEASGCCAVHVWHGLLTHDLVREFCQSGYGVRSFTVNDFPLAKQLVGWGVESICTDFPDRFTALATDTDHTG